LVLEILLAIDLVDYGTQIVERLLKPDGKHNYVINLQYPL